jgi:hypothetical protein
MSMDSTLTSMPRMEILLRASWRAIQALAAQAAASAQ